MKITLRRRHALTVADGAFSHKIYYVTRASKSLYWFKSYGDLSELLDFAYWWSFIGKGLRLQPAQQACFLLMINTPMSLMLLRNLFMNRVLQMPIYRDLFLLLNKSYFTAFYIVNIYCHQFKLDCFTLVSCLVLLYSTLLSSPVE